MTEVEKLTERLEREFEVFREEMLKKSKEEIFFNSHKIHVYYEIICFLTSDDALAFLEEGTVEPLNELDENLLDLVYESYDDDECADVRDWISTASIIESLV